MVSISDAPENKNHRAKTERLKETVPNKADPTERSWRGVLRGHVPSKSLSADSEIPRAHASGHTEKVGEKSDSFSRAERTRPLRPVSRLLFFDFENIPVECFQRLLSCQKVSGHGTPCPYKGDTRSILPKRPYSRIGRMLPHPNVSRETFFAISTLFPVLGYPAFCRRFRLCRICENIPTKSKNRTPVSLTCDFVWIFLFLGHCAAEDESSWVSSEIRYH